MIPFRKSVLVAAGLVLVAGAACSKNDDDGLRAGTQSIDSSKTLGDGETATGDADTNASGDSLGSAKTKLPADPLDDTLIPLRLDVAGLERNDELVELRVTMTNEGDEETPSFEAWSWFVDDSGGAVWDLSGVALVDGGSKKLYLPVLDSEGVCLCTDGVDNVAIPPGETVEWSATFGGVPDDVDTLDVRFPSFPSIDGVPVR